MSGNETSELQAVDFALGSFMSDAFQGLNANDGPNQYREFLSRARNKQIYRYDFDTPQEFVDKLRASKANQKTVVGGAAQNIPGLPVIVYCRKPGLTNGEEKTRVKGKSRFNLALDQAYGIKTLPVALTYKMAFVAWDKLTLDKLEIAWYAYVAWHNLFSVTYQIGEDLFDTHAIIQDNRSVLFSDASVSAKEGRLFAVDAELELTTQVIFGKAVTVPDPVTLTGVHVGYLK